MFKAETYIQRRKLLRKSVGSGLVIFLANEESPMNYAANTYHYRQDSSFLYFFGLSSPGLAAIVDADEGTDTLYGDDIGIEDIIWMGNLPTIKARALEVGVRRTRRPGRFRRGRAPGPRGRPARPLPPALPSGQHARPRRPARHSRQGTQGQGLGRVHQGLRRSAHHQVEGRGPRDGKRGGRQQGDVPVRHEAGQARPLRVPGLRGHGGDRPGLRHAPGLPAHRHDQRPDPAHARPRQHAGQGPAAGPGLRGRGGQRLRLRHHPDRPRGRPLQRPAESRLRDRPGRPGIGHQGRSSPASASGTSISRPPGSWPEASRPSA